MQITSPVKGLRAYAGMRTISTVVDRAAPYPVFLLLVLIAAQAAIFLPMALHRIIDLSTGTRASTH